MGTGRENSKQEKIMKKLTMWENGNMIHKIL